MATLHVRNVPDDLYERLQQEARTQRRSLSSEVVILLSWALDGSERRPGQILNAIRERRHFSPAEVGAPDSTTLLREDRDR